MTSPKDKIEASTSNNKTQQANLSKCPDCQTNLHKCLIQQNYAIVMCPNTECGYPFSQNPVLDNLVYVDDSDILDVAKKRLTGE